MQKLGKRISDFFFFPARERLMVLLLVVVVSILTALPFFIHHSATAPTVEELAGVTAAEKALFESAAAEASSGQNVSNPQQSHTPTALHPFSFDPNTVSEADLVRMGLTEKQAASWEKFRSKGGRFRRVEDVARLYALRPGQADELIRFAHVNSGESTSGSSRPFTHQYASSKNYTPIDINTATQEQWEQLPMVGAYTARQILKHRASLPKGFSSIDQVGETYNLRAENFATFKPYLRYNGDAAPATNAGSSKASGKIDLNRANKFELMQCPAITEMIANAIIIQRRNKGPFKTVDELSSIVFLQPSVIAQIKPCVEVSTP